ncbi:hypothetical protein V525_10360 [Gordonia alkanivorans CGMCC 6845]|jgi:hypothetical protein|uniref:Uncharacterized protein n=1 Tax=Gordonia alkanivorans CGMCC 6845 TaxID=1423140 RepID=W9DKC2_9ACTN|nr:hypothetical protein V525_10360 [Gordonia alkanivorans CGMCC 6845]
MVYEKMWRFAPVETGAFLPDVPPIDLLQSDGV